GQGLRVLELAEPGLHVLPRPALELDLLVLFGVRFAFVEVLRQIEVHLLPHESGRRPEAGEAPPRAAAQTGLLAQLAPRRRFGLLARLQCPGGELDELSAGRDPPL